MSVLIKEGMWEKKWRSEGNREKRERSRREGKRGKERETCPLYFLSFSLLLSSPPSFRSYSHILSFHLLSFSLIFSSLLRSPLLSSPFLSSSLPLLSSSLLSSPLLIYHSQVFLCQVFRLSLKNKKFLPPKVF